MKFPRSWLKNSNRYFDMEFTDECKQVRKCKLVPLRDISCRSEFRISNPHRKKLQIIRIDDCEIKEGRRCDYLVLEGSRAHLIELKGRNLEHGISQIEASMKHYKARLSSKLVTSYIVCSSFPKAITKKQVLQKRFKKQFGTLLKIEKSPCLVAVPNQE